MQDEVFGRLAGLEIDSVEKGEAHLTGGSRLV
jgi:hypothetical protein